VPFCPSCGTQIAAGAACPTCAPAAAPSAGGTSTPTGLADNLAGLLAYLFIPAIVFLVLEPYNRNRFIRFHSFQAILLAGVFLAVGIALGIFIQIPFLGWIMGFLLAPIVGLAQFVLWIILLLKAFQGQMFKLPVIGDIAEKHANS